MSDYDIAHFSSLSNHTVTRLLCGESAEVSSFSFSPDGISSFCDPLLFVFLDFHLNRDC